MKPNLLIIGAMRSGTTSAYRYLSEHPDVFMSPSKEPMFFAFEDRRPEYAGPGDERLNERVTVTWASYETLFAGAGSERWRGEGSTTYLYLAEQSIESMRRHDIDAEVVILVRDPVDRAYSSYQYLRRRGQETLDFESALAAEEERRAANWAPMWHYLRASRYADGIASYRDAFGDDHLHVLVYDDIERDAEGTFRRLFGELGIDTNAAIAFDTQHNQGGGVKSPLLQKALSGAGPVRKKLKRMLPAPMKREFERLRERNVERPPDVDPELRRRLIDDFSDDIARSSTLIGRDLTGWLGTSRR